MREFAAGHVGPLRRFVWQPPGRVRRSRNKSEKPSWQALYSDDRVNRKLWKQRQRPTERQRGGHEEQLFSLLLFFESSGLRSWIRGNHPVRREIDLGRASGDCGGWTGGERQTGAIGGAADCGRGRTVSARGRNVIREGGHFSSGDDEKVSPPPFPGLGKVGKPRARSERGARNCSEARARFEKVRAANRLLDSKDDTEMRSRQTRKWKEHQLRDADNKRRRKDQLIALKAQVESKRQERERKRSSDLKAIPPPLGRAFPCRTGYGVHEEAAAARRNALCRDLDAQIEQKRRLEAEKKQAEVDRELVWAENLKAVIKAQRGRELRVRERERALVHGALEEQVNDTMSAAEDEGEKGRRRTQTVVLDKIVR